MSRLDLADEYFNRSYETVRGTPAENRPVCYAVFCRSRGVLCGVRDVVRLVDRHCVGPIVVRGKSDGERFDGGEVVLTLEGPFGQLVTLETTYLGLLSLSAAAGAMADLVATAGVPVIDMAARHFPPELMPAIAEAAAIGGAAGTSTPAGHAHVHARWGIGGNRIRIGSLEQEYGLYGTIPHALNAVYGGSSIASAAEYHRRCPNIPLTVLIDYEGCERDVVIEAVQRFGTDLAAVRLDTPGNRIHQGGHEKLTRTLEMRILSQAPDRAAAEEALSRYGFGPGVTIEAAYGIRDLLDSMNARSTKIVLSSGFDGAKVRAFQACRAPMDFIGTGSWVSFSPFTSDIIRVQEEGIWKPRCKVGRSNEIHEPADLPVLLRK